MGELNRNFYTEDIWMANICIKQYSLSLIREIQRSMAMRYYLQNDKHQKT